MQRIISLPDLAATRVVRFLRFLDPQGSRFRFVPDWDEAEGIMMQMPYPHNTPYIIPFYGVAPQWAVDIWGGPFYAVGAGLDDLSLVRANGRDAASLGARSCDPPGSHYIIRDGWLYG